MARVSQRLWRAPGRRAKRKAWGFTVQVDGKQKRVYKTEWTKDDAERALAALLLDIDQGPKSTSKGITLGEATERYLGLKARKKSLAGDKRIIAHLKSEFGAETPLADITSNRISTYKAKRLASVRKVGEGKNATERPLSGAAVNRPMALLRHLLTLAHEEWGVLDAVPKIKLVQEPKGRLQWLKPEEAAKLLTACSESKNRALADLVEFAAFTGLRQGEVLGLTWERVDRARGVVLLERTKSDRPREVPLCANADAVLARRWCRMARATSSASGTGMPSAAPGKPLSSARGCRT